MGQTCSKTISERWIKKCLKQEEKSGRKSDRGMYKIEVEKWVKQSLKEWAKNS